MTAQSLFIRESLGEDPGSSRSLAADSPDIILGGTTPLSISELETTQSYETEPENDSLIVNSKVTNYIYVRALNTTAGEAKGRFWLWYAERSLVLWPQNFQAEGITVNGEPQNWVDVVAMPEGIVVGNAFELSQGPQEEGLSLIAVAESRAGGLPPEPPVPGAIASLKDLAVWIAATGNLVRRSTVFRPPGEPSWSCDLRLRLPDEKCEVTLGVQCTGVPVGSAYRFVIPGGQTPGGGEWGTVELGPRVVEEPNEVVALRATFPGGVDALTTLTWEAQGHHAEVGATIEPFLAVALEGEEAQIRRMQKVGGVPIRFGRLIEEEEVSNG